MENPIDFQSEADAIYDELVGWRRDFHRHPELGFEETRTARIVADHLSALGYRVQEGVAKTGVVGLLEGSDPGPVMMLRFDMDALAVQEENETDYVSRVPGKMHACGHDGHVAIGLGLAGLLKRHRSQWAGTIKLVFQPAEEGRGGAAAMLREGVLTNPPVDAVLMLHLANDLPLGRATVTPGPLMAASDLWELTITGLGGHGARPHEAVDPFVAGAQVILSLQTVVSRSVDPLQSAVISVGTARGGNAWNTIPPQLELCGTIRTFDPEVRETVLERMEAIVEGVSRATGTHGDLKVISTCPPVINDLGFTTIIQDAARTVLGADNVRTGERTMGADDAAFFLNEVPGCYMFLGAGKTEASRNYPNHNPRFDFDERALPLGVAILAQAWQLYSQPLVLQRDFDVV